MTCLKCENLKAVCRRLASAKTLEVRDRIAKQCLNLFKGNPLRKKPAKNEPEVINGIPGEVMIAKIGGFNMPSAQDIENLEEPNSELLKRVEESLANSPLTAKARELAKQLPNVKVSAQGHVSVSTNSESELDEFCTTCGAEQGHNYYCPDKPEPPAKDEAQQALRFKFGDCVENSYASQNNPRRFGFFVRRVDRKGRQNPGRYAQVTDGKGDFWEMEYDSLKFARKDKA